MADRGEYRCIRRSLLDGPDFQALPERARVSFVFIKLNFGPAGIEVHYPDALAAIIAGQLGAPFVAVREAMDLLQRKGWIRMQGNVVWIVGHLRHEPSIHAGNPNHRKSLWDHLQGFPRLPIVAEFIDAYPEWFKDAPLDLTEPFRKAAERGSGIPSRSHPDTIADPITNPVPISSRSHPDRMGDASGRAADRDDNTASGKDLGADAHGIPDPIEIPSGSHPSSHRDPIPITEDRRQKTEDKKGAPPQAPPLEVPPVESLETDPPPLGGGGSSEVDEIIDRVAEHLHRPGLGL